MKPNGKLVLIDAYSQIYRGFYAIPSLTNDAGEPTNALFAWARFLMLIDKEWEHEFGAVVFDKGAPRKRLELLPEYKAQRPPMPEDLRKQMPLIREWAAAAGWPVIEQEGHEADDLIAAIAVAREQHETYIVSHDKDLGQLVGNGVYQLVPGKQGKFDRLDAAAIEEKFGIPPTAVRDYIAMVGDTVDNIPGIPGVGPKTAAALLHQFGTIEQMLVKVDEIARENLRELVRTQADNLCRNQQLVGLDRTLPNNWQGVHQSLRRQEPNWDRLMTVAQENGLKSIISSLHKLREERRSPTLF